MTERILIQLDGDPQPSSFDSIVAIDAGVEHLLRYGSVQATSVDSLVHGAMFTRGGENLKRTAIFVGGSDVEDAEQVLAACEDAFFGPVRVSLMLDANGCNTTASAAVVTANRHVPFSGTRAVVLGGTGPVGRRVSQLLAGDGADVVLTSRRLDRAESACAEVTRPGQTGNLTPMAVDSRRETIAALDGAEIIIGCGAAGIELLDQDTLSKVGTMQVAIDLNAVPPAGLGGIDLTDRAKPIGSGLGYGAIGVGGLKMKTHRAAIKKLFTANDLVLDADEIYQIAKSLG